MPRAHHLVMVDALRAVLDVLVVGSLATIATCVVFLVVAAWTTLGTCRHDVLMDELDGFLAAELWDLDSGPLPGGTCAPVEEGTTRKAGLERLVPERRRGSS